MARAKLPRKSTTVDMTAMCDVAFLLLAFFILATKFKPPEALKVDTPNSVSTKIVLDKDVVQVTIDKNGKVYFSVSESNPNQKADILDDINTSKNLGLSAEEKKNFTHTPNAYIGVPFSQLKAFLDKSPEDLKNVILAGIPVLDSNNNEMVDWFRAAATAFAGTKMNIVVKGDDASKYPSFGGVIWALKRNDLMKFQIVTNPVAVPVGTELYKVNVATGTKGSSD
jgi:biopolymer transport protein ExbD